MAKLQSCDFIDTDSKVTDIRFLLEKVTIEDIEAFSNYGFYLTAHEGRCELSYSETLFGLDYSPIVRLIVEQEIGLMDDVWAYVTEMEISDKELVSILTPKVSKDTTVGDILDELVTNYSFESQKDMVADEALMLEQENV